MGCSASKPKTPKQLRRIKYKFKDSKIAQYDEFFNKASETLKICEEIRDGCFECPLEMIEATDVDGMLPEPGNLLEALKVFLWSVSATNEGKFTTAKMDFFEEPPFASFDTGYLYVEQVDFQRPFEKYLKTLVDAPLKVVDLVAAVAEMVQKAVELGSTAVSDA